MGATVSIVAGPERLGLLLLTHSFIQQAFIEPKCACSRLRRYGSEQKRWHPCLLEVDSPVEETDNKQIQIVQRKIKQDKGTGEWGSFVHSVIEGLSLVGDMGD